MAKIYTRSGDGRRIEMSKEEIFADIQAGTADAADIGTIPALTDDQMEHLVDIIVCQDRVVGVAPGEEVVMTYDDAASTFAMDRTASGNVSFSEAFPCTTVAPTHGRIKQLRIFVDRCSIEAFDADGHVAMTNLVFPSEPYNSIKVKGGKATIYEVK